MLDSFIIKTLQTTGGTKYIVQEYTKATDSSYTTAAKLTLHSEANIWGVIVLEWHGKLLFIPSHQVQHLEMLQKSFPSSSTPNQIF